MTEFTDNLRDVFAQFGDISARPMFGGHGIYFDDCMFGLVADDTLYLKIDDQNEHHFTALELPSFEFEKSDGRKSVMSYRLAPESLFENQQEAAAWATHCWEAAKRTKNKKTASKKRGPKKVGSSK